jgi:tripeptide aminopeptidase
MLREIAGQIVREFPRAKIDVVIEKQYRNMADGMTKEPRALKLAEEAVKRAGMTPTFPILRGGTDGARLTELGLPTPNLSTGEHIPHSPLEWTCMEDMEAAVKVLIELAQIWGKERE